MNLLILVQIYHAALNLGMGHHDKVILFHAISVVLQNVFFSSIFSANKVSTKLYFIKDQ